MLLMWSIAGILMLVVLVWCQENSTQNLIKSQHLRVDAESEVSWIKTVVDRMARLENSMARAAEMDEGSRDFNEMLASWADDNALKIAKEAYIYAKASSSLIEIKCPFYELNKNACIQQMSIIKLNPRSKVESKNDIYRHPKGLYNNPNYPEWGTVNTAYTRLLPALYEDNIWFDIKKNYPNPVSISTQVRKLVHLDSPNFTEALIAWSNLVVQDLAHTAAYRTLFTKNNIKCCGENKFRLSPRYRHPFCLYMNGPEDVCVTYVRSMLAISDAEFGPGQQMNTATHFLDGSTIYGTSYEIEDALREKKGGRLVHNQVPNKRINCITLDKCYFTADIRTILDPPSAILHTILIKEHNRIAGILTDLNKNWDDERAYQETKRVIIALIQHITYNEWLPIIIGNEAVLNSSILNVQNFEEPVYDSNVNPSVSNEFANAAMKFITSKLLVNNRLTWKNPSLWRTTSEFFKLRNKSMIDKMGKFLLRSYPNNSFATNEVADSLYTVNNDKHVETIGIDIHRGRDHGFQPYLLYKSYFNNDQSENQIPEELREIYGTMQVELIAGGLVEAPYKGGIVGETFNKIISKQMEATRSGDRYFYDNLDQPYPFSIGQLKELKKVTIAHLICNNIQDMNNIQPSAFIEQNNQNSPVMCQDYLKTKVDWRLWKK